MSPENKALIERECEIEAYGERGIMRLYPLTLETLMNAVRAEERARAVEVVRKIQPFIPYDAKCWKDEIGGEFIEVRKVAAAYLADTQEKA